MTARDEAVKEMAAAMFKHIGENFTYISKLSDDDHSLVSIEGLVDFERLADVALVAADDYIDNLVYDATRG